ncbi:glycosyltransferase family 4 protein [Rheinheimera sp.]|uniref:glycosyltransferase family 4 protein n=1 Tax=Rheinheimera sp. TaxID=1869214 RepID=UPI003AF452BC
MNAKGLKLILGADPLMGPLTGIGHYTRCLAKAFAVNAEVAELKLFAFGRFFDHSLLDQSAIQSSPEQVKQGAFSLIRRKLASSRSAVYCYEKAMPLIEAIRLTKHTDHLFHSPNFFIPKFSGQKVVTFHDLSTVLYPQFHPVARVELANRQMDKAVRSDAHIICDSDIVAAQLTQHYGLNNSQVSRVYLAADDEFRPRVQTECLDALSLFGISYNKFFLFVSTIEPRKNILRLLDGYEKYASTTASPFPLVIVGSEGWNSSAEHQRITQLQRRGLVLYKGYLSQRYLVQLYSAATALLYPSVYEGFGLPVLEAMQSGTAVMTTLGTSMQEFAGEAASYVDAEDSDAMSYCIKRLSEDVEWRHKSELKGIELSTAYSWQHCANETLAVYKKVLMGQH